MRREERAVERIKAQFDLGCLKNPGTLFPIGAVLILAGDVCNISGGVWLDLGALSLGTEQGHAWKRIR